MNVVLSQYYVTKNNPVVVKSTFNPKNFTNTNTNPSINTTPQNIHPKQMNNPISIQNASLKRINSAPSSPFHPKFVNDFSQRALNDTHRTSQDTSVKTMQNG